MKYKLLIFLLLFGNIVTASAQKIDIDFFEPLTYKIVIGLNSSAEKLKDSVAFYSWAYELKLKRFKDSTIVESISVNDSMANVIVKDHSHLKKINFIKVLGNRTEATLVIPISVILTDYNSPVEPAQKISFYDFPTRIRKMFNTTKGKEYNESYIYFQPIMIHLSKRVFD